MSPRKQQQRFSQNSHVHEFDSSLASLYISKKPARGTILIMKPAPKKVLEDALRLPAEARAAIAGRLIESLDDSVDEAAEAAWGKEIARRIDDLEKGKVKTVPWSLARRQILGRSGGRSKRWGPS
jgi:putative addiction module component (TIGR02574 family)